MKVKGSELIAFLETGWPTPDEDWCWDHDLFDDPDPNKTYETDEIGDLSYQGAGEDPTNGDGYNLAALIRKWRKSRDFDIFTVDVPKTRSEEVKAMLTKMGIKFKS